MRPPPPAPPIPRKGPGLAAARRAASVTCTLSLSLWCFFPVRGCSYSSAPATRLLRPARKVIIMATTRRAAAALAAVALLRAADAQTIGVECCEHWTSDDNYASLQDFQASTCYGITDADCPADYTSRWHEGSCDCHQHGGDALDGCCYRQCGDITGLTCPVGETLKEHHQCYGDQCEEECCAVTCAS